MILSKEYLKLEDQTLENETPNDEDKAQCITKVHLRSGGSKGVWDNERRPISMRCDVGLYKAFKQRTGQLGSSVCSAVEGFMVAYLGATNPIVEGKVHLGTTINLEQTVYRQLGRDRRSAVDPKMFVDEGMVGVLGEIAQLYFERFRYLGGWDSSLVTVEMNERLGEYGLPPAGYKKARKLIETKAREIRDREIPDWKNFVPWKKKNPNWRTARDDPNWRDVK